MALQKYNDKFIAVKVTEKKVIDEDTFTEVCNC